MSERDLVDVAKIYPGPALLLAGPGTGKTEQLARRVKFLIEERLDAPEGICVITFTGEAARNMRQRLSDERKPEVYVPPERQPANVRTMHSLGLRIVSDAHRAVGLRKGFTVLNERVRVRLFEDAARVLGFAGEDGAESEECRKHGKCQEEDCKKCRICKRYKELLRGLNALDYDDQIFLACELLEGDAGCLAKWQQISRHLLVDEYQDINHAQYELIRLLCRGQEEGLYVVGDDDQSIYGWRGGSPTYIANFEKHFGPEAVVKRLNDCRRCPPQLLNAAKAFVARGNDKRMPKAELRSIKGGEDPKVAVFDVPSDKYEAKVICSEIATAPVTQDALVLVPGHRFAVPIKREMRRRRIAYDCKSDVAASGLMAINDLVKWLKDEGDSLSLRLCLEQMVSNPALRIPFAEVGDVKAKREALLAKVAALWPRVVSERSTLYSYLSGSTDDDRGMRFIVDSLTELRAAWEAKGQRTAGKFLEAVCRILRPWTSTERFAEEVEDWVEDALARDASAGGRVARVLTMAAAKGLASDLVFVVGLNERVFPPEGLSEEELREKQRLLYVSMTRAARRLWLFSARTRAGKVSYQPAPDGKERGALRPSPFLAWLPEEHVEIEERWPRKSSR